MSAGSEKIKSSSVKERRKSLRRETIRGGTIMYGRDRRSMYCVLLDISDDGAKLVPAKISDCPDTFSLKVALQPDRNCKVIWRRHTHMGVKFEPSQS